MRRSPPQRFDGWIAGIGTAAGLRAVVGHWERSPLGPFSDVMVETPGGWRILLAPDAEVAAYVAATYRFDEVVEAPVTVVPEGRMWRVAAGALDLRFVVGHRAPLGRLLRAVPGPLARRPAWVRASGVPARLLLPGVRTHGSAGGGRREWYVARDLHHVTAATLTWEGVDQGPLAPVDPPVRFGFGSTPRRPSLVRMTTLIRGDS